MRQKLDDFTVQIRNVNTNDIVGTGVVVGFDGKIVTCAHVVKDAGVNPSGKDNQEVGIYFPQARQKDEKKRRATVLAFFSDADDDVVLLQLSDGPSPLGPEQVAVLGSAEGSQFHAFRSYGFRTFGKNIISGWTDGRIFGIADVPENSHLKTKPVQLESQQIDRGMSGAAVLDIDRNLVIGIISETWIPRNNNPKDRDTSWAVNARVLSLEPIRLYLKDRVYKMETSHKLRINPRSLSDKRPIDRFSWNHAPKPVKEWVGRDDLLAELDNEWIDKNKRVSGLIGFGGEGKSSLARYWLEKLLDNHSLLQPKTVFWWGFYESPNVEIFFEKLLDHLGGGKIKSRDYTSANAKVHMIIGLLHAKPYLVVLDGLEVLQHQEGDQYGLLENRDLQEFLAFFAETKNPSFCLITSRIHLRDMLQYETYTNHNIERLSLKDGRLLLRKLKVKGSDNELDKVVMDWDGHALTLSLLAAYLQDMYEGDIRFVNDIPQPEKNETRYEKVHKLLRHYDEHLSNSEKAFLVLFSAFRLPVSENAIIFIIRGDVIKNSIIAPISELSDLQLETVVNGLIESRLVHHIQESNTFTTHPLIRAHYSALLENSKPEDVRYIHRVISRYYIKMAITVPEHPDLTFLSPVVEAIYHACRADDFDNAFEYYSTYLEIPPYKLPPLGHSILMWELGAYDTGYELIKEFFPNRDISKEPLVSELLPKSVLITDLGHASEPLGRLDDAELLHRRARDIDLHLQDFGNVSGDYQNLAEVTLLSGKIADARLNAQQAINFARQAQDIEEEWTSLAYYARAAFLAGDLLTAEDYFNQSLHVHRIEFPKKEYLHDLWGGWYSEYLQRVGRVKEAYEVAKESLDDEHQIDVISQCEYLLGDCDVSSGYYDNALEHYDRSLKIAHNTSSRSTLVEALLARGSFFARRRQDKAAAFSDLKEALGVTILSGFLLYEIDIRIALGWSHRAAGDSEAAKADAGYALKMSDDKGYYWGKVDAQELLDVIAKSKESRQVHHTKPAKTKVKSRTHDKKGSNRTDKR
jgi:tetratricopeptide (TPR) repeat protein